MVARKISGPRLLWFGAIFSIMFSSGLYSNELGIRLENSSELVGGGRYDWTVYVVAEEPVLNEIDHVVYILHPSFPEPKRLIETRENSFSLSANGWGEFLITAKVIFKNGEVVPIEHWLRLEANRVPDEEPEPSPPPPPPEERELAVENTANFLKGERWEWTIYIAAPDEVLEQIECVYYILDPSYREPKREVCDDRGGDPGKGFFLTDQAWEPFEVGVRIRFIDGEIRSLVHWLRTPQSPEE